ASHFHGISKEIFTDCNNNIVLTDECLNFIDITSFYTVKGCCMPWYSPVISATGKVTVCCNDCDFSMLKSNIRDRYFTDIWFNDEEVRRIRYSHIKGNLLDLEVCPVCIGVRSSDLEISLIKEYEKEDVMVRGMFGYYSARISGKQIIPYIHIEVSGECQLNCFYCNKKYEEPSERFMSIRDFRKILESLRDSGVFAEELMLFYMGEPFLNPAIADMIQVLSDYRDVFAKVQIHTNGVYINDNIIRSLKQADYYIRLHISVDTVEPDEYYRIKKGDVSQCLKNSERLISDLADSENIQIIIQLIASGINQGSIENTTRHFISLFRKISLPYQVTSYFDFSEKNVVYIRRLDPFEPGMAEDCDTYFEHARESVSHTEGHAFFDPDKDSKYRFTRNTCSQPFEFLIIRYDGTVTHCCHDTANRNSGYNIIRQGSAGFDDYMGAKLSEYIDKGFVNCRDCPVKDSCNTHDIRIDQALKTLSCYNIDCMSLLEAELTYEEE
ncbi:MAG: radical SAM protein, partial [Candidatus Muiribacteriaceae bacterium]